MDTKRLTETAFKATFTAPMREVTGGEGETVDIWRYVEGLLPEDVDGLDLKAEEVRHFWRDAYDRYDHVLLPLSRSNVYLVVVVDLRNRSIHGHHVLDLGALDSQRPDEPAGARMAPDDQAGGMAEWSKAPVLKLGAGRKPPQGCPNSALAEVPIR